MQNSDLRRYAKVFKLKHTDILYGVDSCRGAGNVQRFIIPTQRIRGLYVVLKRAALYVDRSLFFFFFFGWGYHGQITG